MKPTKRIRTVLYGDQHVSPAELEVLHTPAMQRLYGLRQLGSADRVFVDASHSRFHHVVGVVHQVEKLTSAIAGNLQRSSKRFRLGSGDSPDSISAKDLARYVVLRKPVNRLIGLLHDLTHAPFGHTVEDEIQLVESKHDEPDRQADAFYRLLCQLVAWLGVEAAVDLPACMRPFLSQGEGRDTPEPRAVGELARQLLEIDPAVANACWRLRSEDVARLLAHLNCAMTALLHLEALHTDAPTREQMPRADGHLYAFQDAIGVALAGDRFARLSEDFRFSPHRDAFMLDVVGNTVCADLLDYAQRDSHFLGLRLDHDPDRIAENFTLVSWDASAYERAHKGKPRSVPPGLADPFEGWCLRTAISLFTHKYRTDVPSELMNLLNVRFYLYERAIYHPTKCAAGAMLGTALQLLGWRQGMGADGRPELPSHLRFVGDDVFLHEVRSAALELLDWFGTQEQEHVVDGRDVDSLGTPGANNGLAAALLRLRIKQRIATARDELLAATRLLDRLSARRYLRPVFRALPSATILVGADGLADAFRNSQTRFEAEREIEQRATLRLGSVVIHCPRRAPATKIANVLLVQPGTGDDDVAKLRHIASLDRAIFGEHETAIQAVEQMYASMWRLVVYAAPEQMTAYKEIARVAGRVILEKTDPHRHYADRPDLVCDNDPSLARELESKLGAQKDVGPEDDDAPLSEFGVAVGRIADRLLERDRVGAVFELASHETGLITDQIRRKLEEALSSAILPTAPAVRVDQLVAAMKTYVKRLPLKDEKKFRERYEPAVARLEETKFMAVLASLQEAIQGTPKEMVVHKGFKLTQLEEVLDQLLRVQQNSREN